MAPDCKSGVRKRYAGSNPALPNSRGRCIVVMPLPSKQESRVRFPPPPPSENPLSRNLAGRAPEAVRAAVANRGHLVERVTQAYSDEGASSYAPARLSYYA